MIYWNPFSSRTFARGPPAQVSWIRKRDLHILTVGILTYTNDQRYQSLHADGSDEWTLRITSPQPRDSGIYECQVSTEPKISLAFRLSVIGKVKWLLISDFFLFPYLPPSNVINWMNFSAIRRQQGNFLFVSANWKPINYSAWDRTLSGPKGFKIWKICVNRKLKKCWKLPTKRHLIPGSLWNRPKGSCPNFKVALKKCCSGRKNEMADFWRFCKLFSLKRELPCLLSILQSASKQFD